MEQYTYDILYHAEETHWWFVGRRTLILDQIARMFPNAKNLSTLDIGCGTGIFLESLQRYGESIGVDLSPHALRFCQQRGFSHLIQGDGISLPFPDDIFDIITANDLLEHIDDDEAALQEFLRVLKPGGRLFLFVPAYQFLWSLQDEISHHKRRYTGKQLSQMITDAGFTLEKITYANMLLFPLIFLGRQVLKVFRVFKKVQTENDLHPKWTNALLTRIFCLEVSFLRYVRFSFGVSLLAVCQKSFSLESQPGDI